MALSAVNPYRDLCTGGAQLLEQSSIRADPKVFLRDLHLKHTHTLKETWNTVHERNSSHARALTTQRYPEPGVVSSPKRSLAMVIM